MIGDFFLDYSTGFMEVNRKDRNYQRKVIKAKGHLVDTGQEWQCQPIPKKKNCRSWKTMLLGCGKWEMENRTRPQME